MRKEISFKDQVLDFLLLFFIYLLVSSFPWNHLIADSYLSLSLKLLTGVIFTIAVLVFLRFRYPLQKRVVSFKSLILFLPFFLIIFSNLASSLFVATPKGIESPGYLALKILATIVFAVSEELLFRRMLLPLLVSRLSETKSIFLSSLVFSLLHFLNLLDGTAFWSVLLQVLYTFGIGLILAMMYLYGNSLLLAIIFHACFNVFQNDIFVALYPDYAYTGMRIWITAIAAIFALGYGLFIYFRFRKKGSSSSLDK